MAAPARRHPGPPLALLVLVCLAATLVVGVERAGDRRADAPPASAPAAAPTTAAKPKPAAAAPAPATSQRVHATARSSPTTVPARQAAPARATKRTTPSTTGAGSKAGTTRTAAPTRTTAPARPAKRSTPVRAVPRTRPVPSGGYVLPGGGRVVVDARARSLALDAALPCVGHVALSGIPVHPDGRFSSTRTVRSPGRAVLAVSGGFRPGRRVAVTIRATSGRCAGTRPATLVGRLS